MPTESSEIIIVSGFDYNITAESVKYGRKSSKCGLYTSSIYFKTHSNTSWMDLKYKYTSKQSWPQQNERLPLWV